MGDIYIGGQRRQSKGKFKVKLYFFLFLFVAITGAGLKLSAPMLVENWLNQNSSGEVGYAFSIRDVELSFEKGELSLIDLKVVNPETSSKLLEVPNLTIQVDWLELTRNRNTKITMLADKVDLMLSKALSSEIGRIKRMSARNNDFYMNSVEAKIEALNIIEQKEDQSRTVLALDAVDLKVKDVSMLAINKKTEFSLSSKISDGGKLQVAGKTTENSGRIVWSIQGNLKAVPQDIFNKIAGQELPFSFNESHLNAEIVARSEKGKIIGEITPDIKRLNLIQEKPGVPTQTIARALNDELTFSLPFVVKEEVTLEYDDTFRKLKTYRKYPVARGEAKPIKTGVTQNAKNKKSFSFWPF